MRAVPAIIWAVLVAAAPPCGAAGQWELAGDVAIETRFFPRSTLFDEQQDTPLSPSLRVEPEILREWNRGLDRFTFAPFLRLDRHDENRTHFDLRELNWTHQAETWSLLAGVGKVFWGVTESRHLVDVINQIDSVEDVDEEDKLGQPMVNLTLERSWGALDLFLLPLFRERTFPAEDARLRGLAVILDTPGFFSLNGRASYQSDLRQWYPTIAARYSHSLGQLDLALSHFHGTSREPRFRPESRSGGSAVRPRYDIIDQSGLELQLTYGTWLWKLEAIGRRGHGDYFLAAVAGFEYTVYQLLDTTADLGLLLEALYDGRSRDPSVAPPARFDGDLFAGFRLALNDVKGTEILGGATVDPSSAETFVVLEASRRLGDRWLAEVEVRWPFQTDSAGAARAFARDGFLTLRLRRFF